MNTPESTNDGTLDWMGLAHALALPGCVDTVADAFVADPAGAARAALDHLPPGPLAVHIDVDVLDFIDAPLAENTDCRNTGPTLDQAADALQVAARDPRVRSLSIGELNPSRSAGEPGAIPRFAGRIARVLGARAHS
jgi:arginase